MKKFVENINTKIPYSDKEVSIELNRKNLIITGSNGCGKTALILDIHEKLNKTIKGAPHQSLVKSQSSIIKHQITQNNPKQDPNSRSFAKDKIHNEQRSIEQVLDELKLRPQPIKIDHALASQVDNLSAIDFFDAGRKANVQEATIAKPISQKPQSEMGQIGNQMEQHLVNLYMRRAILLTKGKGSEKSTGEELTKWINSFNNNLKLLMEDESARIELDVNTFKINIYQDHKTKYTFQNLSSGYSSIFSIVNQLLMRAEYQSTAPSDLCGVALIDEIDAHLHVSLQRLILPFLTNNFPSIQFIVTTHSPFVLMSVDDAVVYDLSSNSQIDENLSLFSYSSVMEGVLDTKATSVILDSTIDKISKIVNSTEIDFKLLRSLVNKIKPLESKLGVRERAFYLRGENALLDEENG